jgi:hypothetical protein
MNRKKRDELRELLDKTTITPFWYTRMLQALDQIDALELELSDVKEDMFRMHQEKMEFWNKMKNAEAKLDVAYKALNRIPRDFDDPHCEPDEVGCSDRYKPEDRCWMCHVIATIRGIRSSQTN